MAIAASGAVSFSDLRTEFSGAGAISFGDLYRGGTLIKGNAANNTATNLAASVPASGTINFTNFRGAARGWRKTYSSGAENQSASAIFGTDYGIDYPKEIVINSGVTLGATSTSDEALEISTGGVGSITITNNGTIIGKGGASNAVGGDAFEAFVACTFVNNGFVYGGGGGGGNGGNGGGGSYTSSSVSTKGPNNRYHWTITPSVAEWNNVSLGGCGGSSTTCQSGKYRRVGSGVYGSVYVEERSYAIRRTINSTTNTSGGSGGSGGRGAGYNQTVQSGSNGSNGGTNAGKGGTGGSGGGFGASGSNGSNGNNGNRTNGSGGGSGKAAGKHIRGLSFVTFTNNGTVAGGTA